MAHQKKYTDMKRPDLLSFKEMPKKPLALALDNVRSLHNIGSLFRTADGFSIEKLFLCGITGRPPHKEIRKTAIGAEESVEWSHHPDLFTLLKHLKENYYVVALEQTYSSIDLQDFIWDKKKPILLIVGNEVSGISEDVLSLSDCHIEIEQFGTKHSLNVSVAASIAMFHICNQMK
ncbi:MAG: RNA methyltransferase [Bacteroidota bacterium]|nr:RNA methyltransferase [Bacteroidota bacterium]